MKVVGLGEIEPTSVAGVNWRPLRATLGIQAFGINAYTAGPGETVDAPAGTCVFLDHPRFPG